MTLLNIQHVEHTSIFGWWEVIHLSALCTLWILFINFLCFHHILVNIGSQQLSKVYECICNFVVLPPTNHSCLSCWEFWFLDPHLTTVIVLCLGPSSLHCAFTPLQGHTWGCVKAHLMCFLSTQRLHSCAAWFPVSKSPFLVYFLFPSCLNVKWKVWYQLLQLAFLVVLKICYNTFYTFHYF